LISCNIKPAPKACWPLRMQYKTSTEGMLAFVRFHLISHRGPYDKNVVTIARNLFHAEELQCFVSMTVPSRSAFIAQYAHFCPSEEQKTLLLFLMFYWLLCTELISRQALVNCFCTTAIFSRTSDPRYSLLLNFST
jgi:hypothetical protein